MLLLTNTTDKLQAVTDAAVTVDVHVSYMDYNGTAVTPGRQNTAISTATTTDVLAAPGASTQRNAKTINIRNRSAASGVNVTVLYNQNGTTFELHKVLLKAGEVLEYIEGIGWFTVTQANTVLTSTNTADVTASGADTYLSGSSLNISTRIQVGSIFRWKLIFSKSAAGIATPIFNVRVGTAGSVADSAKATFTGVAQTAVIDKGWADIEVICRDASATGNISCAMRFQHNLTTTGLAIQAQEQLFQATSGATDFTASGLIIGLSVNPGASGVWTFQTVDLVANL